MNPYGQTQSNLTAIYPVLEKVNMKAGAVTLSTTKAQEAQCYVRSYFSPLASNLNDRKEWLISPELDSVEKGTLRFIRPQSMLVLFALTSTTLKCTIDVRLSQINKQYATTERENEAYWYRQSRQWWRRQESQKKILVKRAANLLQYEKVIETADINFNLSF